VPIKAGYWVDLNSVKFDETAQTSWIQAMPLGNYDHPIYGKIEVTPERVQRLATNVKQNARGVELDIDYDHKAQTNEAAGWVKDAEARSDGLWLLVDWTKTAYQKIKEKAYRYFSPEFVDEWTHPKTGVVYQDVLFGGGITNRPFLKDILPINASELVLEGQEAPSTGGRMDPKQLRKALRLPEDASDEQVTQAVDALAQANEGAGPPGGTGPASDQQQQNPPAGGTGDEGQQASEAALKKLAETNPAIKQLMAQMEGQAKLLADQQRTLRLSELQKTTMELGTADNAIPAVVLNELPQVLVEMRPADADKVLGLFKKLSETGLVKLGEKGSERRSERNDAPAEGQDLIHKSVIALMDKDKDLSYSDAMTKVLTEKPELYEGYRTSVLNKD
jgi:phage I-like protein